MASYASQLKEQERWWVIKYIREKQGGGKAATADTAAGAATANAVDSTTNK
jgi:hypothetical protein